jgi:small subunit ribosomal protein S11
MASFLKDTPLVGKKSGRTGTHDRIDAFRPTDISDLDDPDPEILKPPPLPILPIQSGEDPGYFYIHGVATTKNIHVTIADHKHNPIIVTSAGRHGLKHSKRQTVEAGYTTTVAAFEKLAMSKHVVNKVEIVLKGFGMGRRGFLSAISGHHGEFVRQKVVRVTDATPMQIGYIKARNEKRS